MNADSHYFYPFLYINREYLKVTLTPPYVNYCYMPIPMPPAQADFHETPSFCALERWVKYHRSRHNYRFFNTHGCCFGCYLGWRPLVFSRRLPSSPIVPYANVPYANTWYANPMLAWYSSSPACPPFPPFPSLTSCDPPICPCCTVRPSPRLLLISFSSPSRLLVL